MQVTAVDRCRPTAATTRRSCLSRQPHALLRLRMCACSMGVHTSGLLPARRPLAYGFVGHHHAAFRDQFLDVTVAQ